MRMSLLYNRRLAEVCLNRRRGIRHRLSKRNRTTKMATARISGAKETNSSTITLSSLSVAERASSDRISGQS